jgi:neutral amino acid transport system permease protein
VGHDLRVRPSPVHRSGRQGSLVTRGLLFLLLVVLTLVTVAPATVGAQETEPTEDDSSLALSGTARAGRDALEGVRFVVSLGGEDVGEAVTDVEGRWEVRVAEPGLYTVTIDVATLPPGVSLRDPDIDSREVELVDRSRGAIFALEGSVAGGSDAGASGGGADSRFERYIDRAASGVRVGVLVALAAVGLSLIYGVTGLVNFAHAEMVAFGAVVAWGVEDWLGVPLVLAAVVGVVFGAGLGYVLETGLFRPLRRRRLSLISLMVVSIGLAFFLRYMFLIVFGSDRRFFHDYRIQENFDIGPLSLPPKDYVIIVLAFAVLITVGLLLQRTKLGTAMRAVADNRDLAEASGIDVRRTILAVWISGSALASLGGILLGVTQQVSWQMGERQLLLIFAAVTLGGLGTAYGAMVGGLAIGVASEMSTLWLDNDLKFLVALTVLILILIVRPQGLLGQRERFG